ncbi:MAG: RNA methyltransferase [Cyclobacteriaceae bacterium]|nr:RNA methyltransferase [Cyclobacteriaceae bacterium]
MISKQQAKYVKSLKLKKYRKNASAFIVEGAKNVLELLQSDFELLHLFVTEKFLTSYGNLMNPAIPFIVCRQQDLEELGSFETNEYALAVAAMKPYSTTIKKEPLVLALDGINDPGNLGTIIRIADWYGISQIVASHETADFYNPKVINASMGSFTRVSVSYMDLKDFFASNHGCTVYGAYLDGTDIHKVQFVSPAVIVMGNESQGISMEISQFINHKITIGRIGKAESLNVAVSTAIICDNFFRLKN